MNSEAEKDSPQERSSTYTPGYNPAEQQRMGRRTAARAAAFLKPYLRPGLRLLDCGCGPGSITVGLAEWVAPGEVVGMDVAPEQLERARAQAEEQGVPNVTFERGDAMALPFEDGSFDVVFAHAVLKHLADPVAVLREFRRVLRPTGIVGVSDLDWGTLLWEPRTPILDEVIAVMFRVWGHNGASPFYPRHLRQYLREAGFQQSQLDTIPTYPTHCGTLEATQHWAKTVVRWFQEAPFVATSQALQLADEAQMEAYRAAIQAWGDDPDAFFAITPISAVGWVGGPEIGLDADNA